MGAAFRFVLLVSLVALLVAAGARVTATDWRNASREPVGLAPDPASVREAVVQVYGARTVGLKGLFGVHSWVAVKPTDANGWTVYEVIGWRLRWSPSVVAVRKRDPDGRWFGAWPELYAERRGPGVDGLIERIDRAARAYPFAKEYRVWPGPNSNTFTAWIARAVPELEIDLPATAIGKDYLGSAVFGSAPSGSGYQLSLGGLLGVAVSGVDGLEFNLLGLNFGVSGSGVKLPIVGRLGTLSVGAPRSEPAAEESLPVRSPGGTPVGTSAGIDVGTLIDTAVRPSIGASTGAAVGTSAGAAVGTAGGTPVGALLGTQTAVGHSLGAAVD